MLPHLRDHGHLPMWGGRELSRTLKWSSLLELLSLQHGPLTSPGGEGDLKEPGELLFPPKKQGHSLDFWITNWGGRMGFLGRELVGGIGAQPSVEGV